MKWFTWLRYRHVQDQLTRARDERHEVELRGNEREKLVRHIMKRAEPNHFAEGFRTALGGD